MRLQVIISFVAGVSLTMCGLMMWSHTYLPLTATAYTKKVEAVNHIYDQQAELAWRCYHSLHGDLSIVATLCPQVSQLNINLPNECQGR